MNALEKLIGQVYKKWRKEHIRHYDTHPDEEVLACFIEDRLSAQEKTQVKAHLLSCDRCMEAFTVHTRLSQDEAQSPVLEILLKVKDNLLELISASGDILLGQELVPAPVLRSRQIKEFKDEITILKDFKDISVELKIENKGSSYFDLNVAIKKKQDKTVIKDLRVTLLKDDVELESYLSVSAGIVFEHILLGRYKVEISNVEERLATVLIDIKI